MLRHYALLEESRKSWQYVTNDEAVHLLTFFQVGQNPFLAVAKDFVEGSTWIEAHLTLRCGRDVKYETHWIVTYECDMRKRSRKSRKIDIALISMNRNAPVLIDRAQRMKTPEKIVMSGCGIPTVIRLKRLYDGRCFCGYSVRIPRECPPAVAVVNVKNREVGMLGVGDGELRERPYQVIQSSARAINEVSQDKRNVGGNTPNFDVNEVAALLKITFGPGGNGFRFTESSKFALQAAKVFLRPGEFGFGIGY
jgi:hypothetical protein